MSTASLTFDSHSVEQTLDLGRRLGRALRPDSVVALVGTLGSGKTHFVKGIAAGNDTPPDVVVNSPTFVLINEYPGRLDLYHIDVYRLHGSDELDALGFEEMLTAGGAVLIEWADRVADLLPDDHLRIDIAITGDTDRHITLHPTGPTAATLLANLSS